MRRKAASEGFAGYEIRFNMYYRELGQALKRLDITQDAGKLFHPVIRGILLLENSGLNGSEVSAVLATQENSYEYDRVMRTGGESSTLPARQRHEESHAHYSDEWGFTEEDQIDESAWSVWPEHDTWNTGWDESYWDDTSH